MQDRGQEAPRNGAQNTLAILGVCSAGPPATPIVASRAQDVAAALGYGPLTELAEYVIDVAKVPQVICPVNPSIAGTRSGDVAAQSGTGPQLELAGTPFDTYSPKLKIVKGGGLGVAQFALALDGHTYGPVRDIQAQQPARVQGTVDLTGITLASLNGLTFIITSNLGGPDTCTITTPSSLANLLSQLNASFSGEALASLVSGRYLLVESLTEGLSSTLEIGAGTANTALGFTESASTPDTPARIVGTVDLTGLTLADLNGKTFILSSDLGGPYTTTFTTPTSVEDIADQINAVTTTNAEASIEGDKLVIQSTTIGEDGELEIGTGTANGDLGFNDNDTATGTDIPGSGTATGTFSTFEIPKTGITLTFDVGTYVEGEVYSWSTTAPRFTGEDLQDALDALRASGLAWTDVVLEYLPIDAADLLVMASALDAGVSGWQAGNPRIHSTWAMGGPLSETPGSVASDQTNDTAVKNALSSFQALGAVVQGDTYISGREVSGLFRRPLLWGIAARMSAYRLSSDVGNGEQPALEGCSAVGPDGVTLARDEDTARVPMKPQRFTTAHRWRGGVYAVRGVSRAASSSKFRHFGILRMAMLAARTAWEAMKPYDNADRDLNPNGTLLDPDATAIEDAITAKMEAALTESPTTAAPHASAVVVVVDREENVGETNDLSIDWQVQHKGQFETVTGSLGIVSSLTLGGG